MVNGIENTNINVTTQRNTKNSNELGKDEFLKLLITQLKYQDPLSPMEDKEFIAQMAQFSSLEQMIEMNKKLDSISNTEEGKRTSALSLLGKNVGISGGENIYYGKVTGIRFVSGEPKIIVENLYEADLEDIVSVYN